MRNRIAVATALVVVGVIGLMVWFRSMSLNPVSPVVPVRDVAATEDSTPKRSLIAPDASDDVKRVGVKEALSGKPVDVPTASIRPEESEPKTRRFHPNYSIVGTLFSPSGSPMTSGLVRLCSDNIGDPDQSVVVHGDGWFSFQLSGPGRYSLVGFQEACSPSVPKQVELDERTPSITANVELPRPASITGSVHWETGESIKDLLVVARPHLPADLHSSFALSRCFGLLPPVEAPTGNEGEFTLPLVQPALEFDISCTPDPSRPDCTIVEEGIKPGTTDLEIVVREQQLHGAFVHGRLLDVATKQPVNEKGIDLWVAFKRPAGDWVTVLHQKLDSGDGTFRVDGLSPGITYGMGVWAGNFPSKTIGPWLASPEGTQFEVLLGSSGQLDVTVLSRDGRPAPSASATVVCERVPIFPWEGKAAGAEAKVHFFDLDPGIYSVTASKDGSVGSVAGIAVRDTETAHVELRLSN